MYEELKRKYKTNNKFDELKVKYASTKPINKDVKQQNVDSNNTLKAINEKLDANTSAGNTALMTKTNEQTKTRTIEDVNKEISSTQYQLNTLMGKTGYANDIKKSDLRKQLSDLQTEYENLKSASAKAKHGNVAIDVQANLLNDEDLNNKISDLQGKIFTTNNPTERQAIMTAISNLKNNQTQRIQKEEQERQNIQQVVDGIENVKKTSANTVKNVGVGVVDVYADMLGFVAKNQKNVADKTVDILNKITVQDKDVRTIFDDVIDITEGTHRWANDTSQNLIVDTNGGVGKWLVEQGYHIGRQVTPWVLGGLTGKAIGIGANAVNAGNITATKGGKVINAIKKAGKAIKGQFSNPSTAYFVAGAGGSYLRDAEQRGLTGDKALAYAWLMGGVEGTTEAISLDFLGKAAGNLAKGQFKQMAINYVIGGLEEMIQEGIIEPISESTAKMLGGEYSYENMIQRMFEAGVDGLTMYVLLGGISAGYTKAAQVVGKAINGNQVTQAEIEEAIEEIVANGGSIEQAYQDYTKAIESYTKYINDNTQVAYSNKELQQREDNNAKLQELNKEYELLSRTEESIYNERDKAQTKEDIEMYNEDIKAVQKRISEVTNMIDNIEKNGRNIEQAVIQAKQEFGTTNDFKEAGYLLQDGTMLDFSGKNQGSNVSGRRTLDHRDIQSVNYEMREFMEAGNIRLQPESNGFELMQEPTPEQYKTLSEYIDNTQGEVVIDIYKDNGMNRYDSASYKQGTPTAKVINDIKTYFKTGKFPPKSIVAEFRYSNKKLEPNAKVDISENKVYNKITKNEKMQVQREVMTWRAEQPDGIGFIDLSANGYKSYSYIKNENDVTVLQGYTGSEQFINEVRSVVLDEINTKSIRYNNAIEIVRNRFKNDYRSNDVSARGQQSRSGIEKGTRDGRQQRRSNISENVGDNGNNLSDGKNEIKIVEPKDKTQKLIQEFMKENFNIDVQYYTSNKNFKAIEFVRSDTPRTIYVKNNSKNDMLWATGHGFLHTLKHNHEDVFNELVEFTKKDISQSQIDNYISQVRDVEYQKKLKKNNDMVIEEMIADEMGNNFVDRSWWEKLLEYSKELFNKVVKLLKNVLNKISGKKYRNELTTNQVKKLNQKILQTVNTVIQRENIAKKNMFVQVSNARKNANKNKEVTIDYAKQKELKDILLKNKNLNAQSQIPVVISKEKVIATNKNSQRLQNDFKNNVKNGEYTNKATGYVADINVKTKRKIIFPKANVDKSNKTYILRMISANNLPQLFENAVYIDTLPKMKNKTTGEIGYHHFVAPIEIDGNLYRVLITGKEKQNSNKLYSLDIEVIPQKNSGTLPSVSTKSYQSKGSSSTNSGTLPLISTKSYQSKGSSSTNSTISIADLVNNVKLYIYDTQQSQFYTLKDIKFSMNKNQVAKDNQGRTLTKEQQEYFKDSKIRDENGNLLTVYHGSNKDFTVFNRNFNFYTDSREVANTYTNNYKVYEGYINMTNPLTIDVAENKWSMLSIEDITIDGITDVEDFLHQHGSSTWMEEGELRTSSTDLVYAIEEAIENGEIDSYDGIIIKNIYDEGAYSNTVGEKLGTDYITFNSNQFKNLANKKPTSNPDIRYSNRKSKNWMIELDKSRKQEIKEKETKHIENREEIYDNVGNEVNKNENEKKADSKRVVGISRNGATGRIQPIYRKFKQDFIEKGYADLNDKKINSKEDLADIGYLFRNPKYETFRIIYVLDNKIVGQEAVSTKIPGYSYPGVTDKDKSLNARKIFEKIKSRKSRLGANGYYLVHNHPSGNVKASQEDVLLTKRFIKEVNGFKGHLIVNSGHYAWLGLKNKGLKVENYLPIKNYKEDEVDKLMNESPTFDVKINSLEELVNLMHNVKNSPNYSTLIFTDSISKIRLVQDLPNSFWNMKFKQIRGYIRNQAKLNGASRAFLATDNEKVFNKADWYTNEGILEDTLLYLVENDEIKAISNSRANELVNITKSELFDRREKYRSYRVGEEVSKYDKEEKANKNWMIELSKQRKQKVQSEIINENNDEGSAEENKEEPKIAKILDEIPTNKKLTIKELKDTLVNLIVNKGSYIDELAKRTGNMNLTYKYDKMLSSIAEGQYVIGKAQTNNSGEDIGKSVMDIWAPVEKAGLVQDFSGYLLHKLNIERMGLEEKALEDLMLFEAEHQDFILNGSYKNGNTKILTLKEIEALASDKGNNDSQEVILANEYLKLNKKYEKTKNKPVFGYDMTADKSKAIVKAYEEEHPEFIEWAKDINIFNKNQLKNMVDAGLVSEEAKDIMEQMYSNYVRIQRDNSKMGRPIINANGTIKIKNPVQTAKGGNNDILPLKDMMAEQAIQVKGAVRRNELGLELLKELGGVKVEDYDAKLTKSDKENPATLIVFDKGQAMRIEITDGIYESLVNNEHSKFEEAILQHTTQPFLKLQRSLLTVDNPIFIITNFFKDLGDAPLNSKYPKEFFRNYIKGAYYMATQNPLWKMYQANGGMQNTYFEFDERAIKPKSKGVRKFLDKIKMVNEVVEQAPRFAEFISTLQDGKTIQEAMYNAAEVTTNFKRGGEVTKFINRNFSNFVNASIQGFDKQYRNFTGQNGARGYIQLLLKCIMLGVLPQALNHLLLKDDEDYKELPTYVKDKYYLFKTEDNDFIRIPKGRAVSIIQSAFRRTWEAIEDKDKNLIDAFEGFVDLIGEQIAPNNPIDSNLLSPIIQAGYNKNWFGEEIENQSLQNRLPSERYDAKTDEFSKLIGGLINVSPKKINYIIDQYTGWIGDVGLPLLTKHAEGNVLTDKFTVSTLYNNNNTTEFYDTFEELTQLRNYEKDNGIKEDTLTSVKLAYITKQKDTISDLYSEIRTIQNSNDSDKEKIKQTDKIQEQIIDICRTTNNKLKEVTEMEDLPEQYLNTAYFEADKDINGNSISGSSAGKKAYWIMNESNLSTAEKNDLLSKIANTEQKQTVTTLKKLQKSEDVYKYYYGLNDAGKEKYISTVADTGINQKTYIDYKNKASKITADKDSNGDTISGSKKKKIITEIAKLKNTSTAEKLYLIYLEGYTIKSGEIQGYTENSARNAVANWILNMKLTTAEKVKILEYAGYDVNDGRVTWK